MCVTAVVHGGEGHWSTQDIILFFTLQDNLASADHFSLNQTKSFCAWFHDVTSVQGSGTMTEQNELQREQSRN